MTLQLAVIGLCLVVSAFFSAAEIAFLAANRVRLRHMAEQGSRVARGYLEAFRHPERLLSTAMMGVTIAHVSASAVATTLMQGLEWSGRAAVLATALLTPVMLIIGEIVPKALAQSRATGVALRLFDPLRAASWLLTPLVALANFLVRAALRGIGFGERRDPFVSRDDLRLLFESEPQGSTDVREEEREMIEGIFDLVETSVREIMVPLVDVVAVEEVATVDEVVASIQASGRSRLPVYRERIDNIIGVVTAQDILVRAHRDTPDGSITPLLRPAYYVPLTTRISDLLREMQRQRTQLAVVVDEYGGAQGIVTVEDIVEEIVGEIEDEHELRPSVLTPLPDGSYLVAARIGIDELNESLEWDLPKKDYETVGGLVLASLGRIPRPGEEVAVGAYQLSVVDADERRILKVKVKTREADRPPVATSSPPEPP